GDVRHRFAAGNHRRGRGGSHGARSTSRSGAVGSRDPEHTDPRLTHRSRNCSTTGVTSADQTSAAPSTSEGTQAVEAGRKPATSGADRQLTDQGRERKQQLVEAAMALFAERGYSATRIVDICERAGVAK